MTISSYSPGADGLTLHIREGMRAGRQGNSRGDDPESARGYDPVTPPIARAWLRDNLARMIADTHSARNLRGAKQRNAGTLPEDSARALVQEISTGRYLGVGEVWTSELEQAVTFPSVSSAIDHMRRLKLVVVQVASARNLNVCEVISPARIGVEGWRDWLTRSP